MKASINWLKEYVDIKLSPAALAEKMIMSGVHVASVSGHGDDTVLEFEITANRNDCLSMIGLAREIAAETGAALKMPDGLDADLNGKPAAAGTMVTIKAPGLCSYYSGRIIKGIKVGPSPEWIVARLKEVDIRSVNNVVDITNYILMETGQPMHAFDLDKIKGNVSVRPAIKGEKIKVIDGSEKILDEEMLVIADDRGPIAVAGVMGGLETEVSMSTRNILLESAWFDPISVRRTARKLAMSSESSYRFERKVDASMVLPASNRAASLILKTSGGSVDGLAQSGSADIKKISLGYSPSKANVVLNLEISVSRQKEILSALGFEVSEKDNGFTVTVPSFRRDIIQEADIIEEVARINGYDMISETIPKMVGNPTIMDKSYKVKKEVSAILSRLGLKEIITYNLVPEQQLNMFHPDETRMVRLINPLSQDQAVMTQTLLLGMVKAMSWNVNRKNTDLAFFEIGKTYFRDGEKKYEERPCVSIGLTGHVSNDWVSEKRAHTFYDLKGILWTLLERLGIKGCEIVPSAEAQFCPGGSLMWKGRKIGAAGSVDKKILKAFDINTDVFCCELSLDAILEDICLDKAFTPIPRFPSVVRDISILAEENTRGGSITSCIKEHGKKLVRDVYLLSTYKGEKIPHGKIGLLYRVEYADPDKTLTDDEVDREHQAVLSGLEAKLKVSFR